VGNRMLEIVRYDVSYLLYYRIPVGDGETTFD
jgi:hypothetical protein